jgi:hypothetical protein
VIVTDGESPVDEDGVGILEAVLSQMTSIENCMLCPVMIGKSTDLGASKIKRENAKLLKSCADATGGHYLEGSDVSELYRLYTIGAGFSTRPQLTKVVMEFTPQLKFPCVYFALISKAKVLSLVKSAVSIQRADGSTLPLSKEDSTGFNKITQDRTHYNPDDEDEEVAVFDQVHGFKYGSQYIPFEKTEEESLKLPSDGGLIRVIGFLTADRLPRHHFLSATVMLQGSPLRESAQEALAALAAAMRESDQICLARLVSKARADPILVALVPPQADDGTLIVHRLPMQEDIRDYLFATYYESADANLESVKGQLYARAMSASSERV